MSQIDSSALSFLGSTVQTDVEVDEGSVWTLFFHDALLAIDSLVTYIWEYAPETSADIYDIYMISTEMSDKSKLRYLKLSEIWIDILQIHVYPTIF